VRTRTVCELLVATSIVAVVSIDLCAHLQASSDGLYVRRSPSVPTVSDVEQWKVDVKRRSVVIVCFIFYTVSALSLHVVDAFLSVFLMVKKAVDEFPL